MLMLMATLVKICASRASLAYEAKQAKSSGMGSGYGQKELENRVQGKMTACLLKTNLVLVRSGHELKDDSNMPPLVLQYSIPKQGAAVWPAHNSKVCNVCIVSTPLPDTPT